MPLREKINTIKEDIDELERTYADANQQLISHTIAAAKQQKLIVTLITFFTLIMATFFTLRMIRSLTRPLKEAELWANRIASGEIKGEFIATGIRPRCAEQLAQAGIDLRTGMFLKEGQPV